MWIKETFVNETEGYVFSEGDWIDAGIDNLSELFRHLKSLYGNARNMYRDRTDGSSVKIGWVFEGRASYDDTGESYRRAVWVEVSTTQPQRLLTNISSPWPASKEDLS
jgi:hypothetical protein